MVKVLMMTSAGMQFPRSSYIFSLATSSLYSDGDGDGDGDDDEKVVDNDDDNDDDDGDD
jgi:hypothetical protein